MSVETEISIQELCASLEVTPPYLALQNMAVHDHQVFATLRPEQPLYQEAGIIAACEAGRHLALIGSIGAARCNPRKGRHFYLATKAKLYSDTPSTSISEHLIAIAEAADCTGKQASARCAIKAPGKEGRTLYRLETEYQVLSERLFKRMFAQHHQPTESSPNTCSPYARVARALDLQELNQLTCRTQPQTVQASECAGHFPNFPSLPVAILMGRVARVAGTLLAFRAGDPQLRYRVAEAEIEAHQLAFAGEELVFEARFVRGEGDRQRFSCEVANTNGTVFGEALVDLLEVRA